MSQYSEVLLMDRMEYLNRFPDKFFDWCLDDPPYFAGPESREYYGNATDIKTGVKRVNYGVTEKWIVPGKEYFDLLIRKSKNQIIWGVNYYDYIFGPGRIVWDKCNADSSYSDCELAYCSAHDSVRMFRFMWNGMCQGKSVAEGHIMQGNKKLNEKRIHPTQKPVPLYSWLFTKYCEPGQKVISCHVGSGSDRIAAWFAGVDFYGCELDPNHHAKQDARFNDYLKQPLFQQPTLTQGIIL